MLNFNTWSSWTYGIVSDSEESEILIISSCFPSFTLVYYHPNHRIIGIGIVWALCDDLKYEAINLVFMYRMDIGYPSNPMQWVRFEFKSHFTLPLGLHLMLFQALDSRRLSSTKTEDTSSVIRMYSTYWWVR